VVRRNLTLERCTPNWSCWYIPSNPL